VVKCIPRDAHVVALVRLDGKEEGMDHKRTTMWLTVSLLLAGLLTGCGYGRVTIGMVENHLPGRWKASYTTLTGTKEDTVRADAGQTLTVDYDVKVDKGTLSLQASERGNPALWKVSLQEDAKDAVELSLEQGGLYTIAIDGTDAGGSFDLSWELE
jgi:hypothetical protein